VSYELLLLLLFASTSLLRVLDYVCITTRASVRFEEEELFKRREETSYSTSTTSAGQVFVGLHASDRTMLREPLCNVLFSVVCLPTAIDCLGTPLIKRRHKMIWSCIRGDVLACGSVGTCYRSKRPTCR